MITVNDWKPLSIMTKSPILDVAEVIDLPLGIQKRIPVKGL